MVFFSSLGSVLDFQATWRELEAAGPWMNFILRWNRWWLADEVSRAAFARVFRVPDEVQDMNFSLGTDVGYNPTFCAYLDRVEAIYRRDFPALFAASDVCATVSPTKRTVLTTIFEHCPHDKRFEV